MIRYDIIAGLRAPNAKAALADAVGHVEELAPAVYALAGKFCQGVHLLPAGGDLLFNGLDVLAAARHPGLCDHLIEIARQPDDALDHLFPIMRRSALRASSSASGIRTRSRCSPS
jgi:hypothetical protein